MCVCRELLILCGQATQTKFREHETPHKSYWNIGFKCFHMHRSSENRSLLNKFSLQHDSKLCKLQGVFKALHFKKNAYSDSRCNNRSSAPGNHLLNIEVALLILYFFFSSTAWSKKGHLKNTNHLFKRWQDKGEPWLIEENNNLKCKQQLFQLVWKGSWSRKKRKLKVTFI